MWLLLQCLLVALCRQVNAQGGQSAARPDHLIYNTQESLMDAVQGVVERNPEIMKMEFLERAVENYAVSLPVVTVEPGGQTESGEKLRLLVSFGEHGREIITTELALRILQCFDEEVQLQGCLPDTEERSAVQSILSQTILKIIPMENPRGREHVEKGELCERKNGRGVDINRNWDIEFGKRESDYDPEEEYAGEAAFSEPETVILRDLATAFEPHVWVGVHSGMCAVFMPYDHVGVMPKGASAEAQYAILQTLKKDVLPEGCAFGPGGKTVGYVAHGTGTDYMYTVLHVPLAFTWEIYGNQSVPYEDCFGMFNPTSQEVFNDVLSMWILTFFKFVHLLPDHPDTPEIELPLKLGDQEALPEVQATLLSEDPSDVTAQPVAVREDTTEQSFDASTQPALVSSASQPTFQMSFAPLLIGVTPLILGMIVVIRLFVRRPRKVRDLKDAV